MTTPALPKFSPAHLTLVAASLGFAVISLDVSVVNVALERVREAFQTDVTGLQWVLSAYTLVFASLLLSTGALGDRLGPRPVYAAGLGLFTLASVGCALSGSVESLVAARIGQGLAAALCVPASFSLITMSFPDTAARARAIGTWAGIASAALGAGPLVGGMLINAFGWESIFLINLPLGLIGVCLTLAHAPRGTRPAARSLDPLGQLLAVMALASLTAGFIEAGRLGWGAPLVLFGFAVFAACGAGFLLFEARHPDPMLPLGLMRTPAVAAPSFIGMAINFAFYGLMFAVSLFFQVVKGYSPLQTGLAFLPMTGVITVVNLLAGRLSARLGPKMLILFGLSMAVTGFLWLADISATTPYGTLVPRLLLIGCGAALVVPPINIIMLAGVDHGRVGIASGVLNAARQIGGVIGVGVFGSLVAGSAASVTEGLQSALLLSALAMILSIIVAACMPRKHQVATVTTGESEPQLPEI
ncbi:MFS transporter [Marinobacter halodurans]|uniref:MFS transporter n=1 Tax=Marinobacter halodurans TaxID=2528979 RepID=A0ABY1ZLP8_9GAMM|nr:MFS transporter [Marinobacter halodurans]TBW54647.1 MFS transporter [Marinobacter halodurans]